MSERTKKNKKIDESSQSQEIVYDMDQHIKEMVESNYFEDQEMKTSNKDGEKSENWPPQNSRIYSRNTKTNEQLTLPERPTSIGHSMVTNQYVEHSIILLPKNSKILTIINEILFNDLSKIDLFLKSDTGTHDIDGCSILRLLDICSIYLSKTFIDRVKNIIRAERCSNLYLCGIIDSEIEREKSTLEKSIEVQKNEINSLTDVISSVTKSLSLSSERLPLLFATIPKVVESLNSQYKFNDRLSARLSDSTNELLSSLKEISEMKESLKTKSMVKKFELTSEKYTSFSQSVIGLNTNENLLNIMGYEHLDEEDNVSFLAQILSIKGTKVKEEIPNHIFGKLIKTDRGILSILFYYTLDITLKESIKISKEILTTSQLSIIISLIINIFKLDR